MSSPVDPLGLGHREEVVDVLTAAFHRYPVMRFCLGDDNPAFDAGLRAMVQFYTDKRLLSGWPVLGIRADGRLIAATLVTTPEPPPSPDVDRALETLKARIGPAAFERMLAYERVSDLGEPPTRHCFVGMLGVRPEWQGHGLGRRLLDRVQQLATDRGDDGVCLATEEPRNVAFYRHLGFEVIAEAAVSTLHTWMLYRRV